MSRVLVTGSNGFIGSHLVERLTGRGDDVVCMVRETSDTRWLKGISADYVCADLCSAESLKDAVCNVEKIYHVGGAVRAVMGSDLYRINSEGTRNLVETVKNCGSQVENFIYVSSQAAWGPSGGEAVSDYGKSKKKAEDYVKSLPNNSIVIPAAVYGPRDEDFLSVFRMADRFGVFLRPAGAGQLSFIHVEDCVKGIINVSPGERVFLSDGENYTWEEVAYALQGSVGKKVRCLDIPGGLVKMIGTAASAWGMLTSKPAVLNKDKVKEIFAGDWVMPSSGIEVKYKLNDGFRQTYQWYIEKGRL